MTLTHLHEWLLWLLLENERKGVVTKRKDIFNSSYHITPQHIVILHQQGLILYETDSRIPSRQGPEYGAIFSLTEKGRNYVLRFSGGTKNNCRD